MPHANVYGRSDQENKVARIFITGSSEGLGLMAGQRLADAGHSVVLHARSDARAKVAKAALPAAEAVVVGDVSTIAAMRAVADQANALGPFDAVIHNVGVGYRETRRIETTDGLSLTWAVNVLAPYVLTALMRRPHRLVYLSSGLHRSGNADLADIQWERRPWDGSQAYCDTKLHDVLLTFAVARRWPDVRANALEPGWVATRMGGAGATDDLSQGSVTQAWLATSDEPAATVSGNYFYHQRPASLHAAAKRADTQDRLIDCCREVSGIPLA
jgi:NAD(P)-dependent dehydrogenase (short-subunit alcohol dehydrogenase family)